MESPGFGISDWVSLTHPEKFDLPGRPPGDPNVFIVSDLVSDKQYQSGWRVTIIPRTMLFAGNPDAKIDVDLNDIHRYWPAAPSSIRS